MRMKWLGIGVLVFIAVLYIAICFAAATYDEKGKSISGWRRWLRFVSLFPWPLISTK
jgi:hypothetical protein